MIGDPIDRVDGRLKVTGGAQYSAEVPIEHVAYGAIVTSTIARGRVTAFDTAAASALSGVLAVLTADNAPQLPQAGRAAVSPPAGRVLSLLQSREVAYNGEPIALVVAESFEQAAHAILHSQRGSRRMGGLPPMRSPRWREPWARRAQRQAAPVSKCR